MHNHIAHISLLVDDYDRAIAYYTEVWGFSLIEDTPLEHPKRWVLIKPAPQAELALLLAQAASPEQKAAIGNQSGGRVFLFLHTSNFQQLTERLNQHAVTLVRGPEIMPWGEVAVYKDWYGNLWDVIQKA